MLAGLQPGDSFDRSSETHFLWTRLTIRRAPLRNQGPQMTCCLSSAQLEVIFITTAQQWSPSCPAVEPQLPSTPASAAQILCDDPSAPAFGVLVNHSPAPASYTLSSWFGHCLVCPLVGPCLCSPTVNRFLHCPWVSSAVPCSLSAAQLACALSSLPSPPPGSLSASLIKTSPWLLVTDLSDVSPLALQR